MEKYHWYERSPTGIRQIFSPTYIANWELRHHLNLKEALLTLSLTNASYPKLALFIGSAYIGSCVALGGGGGV
jgi:hypothetical protein